MLMVLFWSRVGIVWLVFIIVFVLFGKVGLTLRSQAFVYRIVIDYKMRSPMNDKPVLPKTGVE